YAPPRDLNVLVANIAKGEDLYESVREYIAWQIANGMKPGPAVNYTRAPLQTSRAPRDALWQESYRDIPYLVHLAIVRCRLQPEEPAVSSPPPSPSCVPPTGAQNGGGVGRVRISDDLAEAWEELKRAREEKRKRKHAPGLAQNGAGAGGHNGAGQGAGAG